MASEAKTTTAAAKATGIGGAAPIRLEDVRPTCALCECGFFPIEDGKPGAGEGQCRRNPPREFMFIFPPIVQGGGPELKTFSMWPPVGKEQWCVDGYKPKAGARQ